MGQALRQNMDPPLPMEKPAPHRRGPRPLHLHLMTALCVWLSWPIVRPGLRATLPNLKNASANPDPDMLRRLENILEKTGTQNPALDRALAGEAVARARRFIAGIRAYRHHPDRRDVAEAPVIWSAGTTRLRDYNPSMPDAPIVLVIPSLINRYDILDLDFASSFLRTLAGQGLRPLVVDWDVPGDTEKNFDLTAYVTQRLIAAMEFIAKGNTAPMHVLGYCMGGLLALAVAALRPERVKTLTLMATPWDFHRPDPAIGASFRTFADQMEPTLKTTGHLPVDIIQSLFATFQPLQTLTKFTEFAGLDPASMEARQFVLLEDWLNDGVPLTAPVARECLRGWYGGNNTAKLDWRVGGTIIDPRAVTTPSYVIVPGKDRIVPPESALPLAKLLPHATLHEPMMGHIGMIASRNAAHQVWAPLLHWLGEHG